VLGSVVDTLISEAHNINLYLLGSPRGDKRAEEPTRSRANTQPGLKEILARKKPGYYRGYLWAVVVTVASTLVARLMFGHFELANLVMVFLLGVVFIATRHGRGASILASVLGMASLDFFFVDPYLSFSVSDTQFLVTLAAMLIVAMLISNLMANVSSQAKVAAHRERRATVLYSMSKEMANTHREDEIVRAAVRHIHSEFGSRNVILFPDANGRIVFPQDKGLRESLFGCDLSVAQWVMDHNEMAGQGTNTLPGGEAIYFPLGSHDQVIGVLALLPVNLRRVFLPEQQKLLDTFIRQIAQAVARVRLAEQARKSMLQMETERLRNSLLSSISHDLRTPLATIVGSASALAENNGALSEHDRAELSSGIYEEAQRMSKLVNNILDMAKLDAGVVALNRQWHPVEEIIGTVLTGLQKRLEGRKLGVKLPPGLPMIYADAGLIEQVLVNLLENALRYTPEGSPLEISVQLSPFAVEVFVADRGPGVPKGMEAKLFEKFYRVRHEAAQSGVGLGLAICRAIVEAHGGTIQAQNRASGGAIFSFMIPVDQQPPPMEQEG
jgi:two-component system sensor histidine kinase KdpD